MRYQGSKAKLSKKINELVMTAYREGMLYIEPFAGGCNSFSRVPISRKLACDSNRYIIALWNGIKDGTFEIPEYVTKEMYDDVRESYRNEDGRYSDAMIGYVSVCCSYGGGFWNGYAHYNPKKHENHIEEAKNGLLRQISGFYGLQDSIFLCSSYESLTEPFTEECFVYCDPPYADTKKYKDDFDSEMFWNWCRDVVSVGKSIVMVSEYNAPSDFVCIYEKGMQDGMSYGNGTKTEKIFVHETQAYLFGLLFGMTA